MNWINKIAIPIITLYQGSIEAVSIPFIFIILLINLVYISYSHHQLYILINFVSLLILLFASLIKLFDIYLISFFVPIVYSGAIIIIFLFVITVLDQTEISISDNYKFIPLLLFIIVQAYLLNLLWPLMNQLNKNGKMSILDIDTLFSDFIFIDLHKIGIYPGGIEMFNRDINVSNLRSNENDMQGIANILYNDMNVFLLIVGFTLFISLILLISNISYSFVLKKRNTLSNVDIYKVLENLRLVELMLLLFFGGYSICFWRWATNNPSLNKWVYRQISAWIKASVLLISLFNFITIT